VIIGGPSCRPWSPVNLTRRGKNHKDYRLLSRYFKHIRENKPNMFIMENVPLLAKESVLQWNLKRLRKSYSVASQIITYSDFGAATKRRRMIIFGTENGDANLFFEKLNDYKKPSKHVKDVIWNLRNKEKGEVRDHDWPELKTIDRYRHYYETGKYGWYILNWDKPAPSFGNVMKTYILHPYGFNGHPTRVISVKEAMLIMGYDADFRFPESFGLGARYQMVVDSVSPVFSRIAATVVKELLLK
jgi:DNA (cytosine-5)-methyltransferase 1